MPSGFQLAHRQAEAYEAHTRAFMEGSARLLAEGARIGPGDVVLDLACGTGLVTRHAVGLVAPNGRVVGADINPAMLYVAGGAIGDIEGDVEWVEAPCDALPFDDATFTHVICQQGMQFFPDPVTAMAEARRVLRADGVLIATVWATPGQNPYIESQLDLLAALDPALAQSVQRATPADADDFLLSTAHSAGFGEIGITMLEHHVEIGDLGTWFLAQTSGTPWGPSVAALTDGDRHELVAAMADRLAEYATAGGHRIPFRSFRLEAHPAN